MVDRVQLILDWFRVAFQHQFLVVLCMFQIRALRHRAAGRGQRRVAVAAAGLWTNLDHRPRLRRRDGLDEGRDQRAKRGWALIASAQYDDTERTSGNSLLIG